MKFAKLLVASLFVLSLAPACSENGDDPKPTCERQCTGKLCGPDGCGGTCGSCPDGFACNDLGLCLACTPDCSGRVCGTDGCGGTCGTCPSGTCNETTGKCDGCTPSCDGRSCGPDGCGGTCGDCGANQQCGANGGCIANNPLTACEKPTPQYVSGTQFTAGQWCEMKAKVLCDRQAACCQIAADQYQKCVDAEIRACDSQDLIARIEAGITQFNVDSARLCLDAEAARMACDWTASRLMTLPACDDYNLFPYGQQALGAPCFDRNDCAKMRCDRVPGTCGDNGAGGTCQPYKGLGEECNSVDLYCNPIAPTGGKALYCDQPEDQPTGQCVNKKEEGESCTAFFQCKSKTWCNAKQGETGVCKATIAKDQTCGFEDQCATGFRCAGRCVALYSATAGMSCRNPDDGIYGSGEECDYKTTWCKGATTTAFGTCTAFTAVGQACEIDAECGPTAACAGEPKKCVARQELGGTCVSSRECKWGLTCQSGHCTGLGQVGAACASNMDCVRYLQCDTTSHTCTAALSEANGPCTLNQHCASGFCTSSKVCAPLREAGQLCNGSSSNWDDACVSGDCEKLGDSSWQCRAECTFDPPRF